MSKIPARLLPNIPARQRLGAVIGAILLAGTLFTLWTVRRENIWVRTDLLQEARLVAQALPLECVQALTGTATDEAKPEYRLLKEHLRAAMRIQPDWRWIYLMGRTNGMVFFYVDSEAPDSPDYSPPGQLYEEASPVMHRFFDRQVSTITEGPVQDRWGRWISAGVPLANPRDGQLLAVLGIDVAAEQWQRRLMRAAAVPLLATALLLAMTAAGYQMRRWRHNPAPGRERRWHRLETALVAGGGLILTLAAVWAAHSTENRNRQEAFAALARDRSGRILRSFHNLRDAEIEGIAHFIEGSVDVTREEFRSYARYLVRESQVLAWGWVPVVPAPARDGFEQQTRENGLRGYQIWEIGPDGQRTGASGRNAYYPLHYVESFVPLAKHGITAGRDLGALPEIRRAMARAVANGMVAATDLCGPLPGASSPHPQILVFRPLFRPEAPRSVKGFAMAMLDPRQLLEAAAGEQLEGSRQIALELWQLRPDRSPERLAASPERLPDGVATAWTASRPVMAFGQTYAVAATPTPEFFAEHPAYFGWLVLLAGLSLTTTGALLTGFVVHRREDLERQVSIRTAALAESIRRFNLLARQNRVARWEVDADGLYRELSDLADTPLGYRADELVGRKHIYDLHPEVGRERFRATLAALAAKGQPISDLVHPVQAKSGEILWFFSSGIPVRDAYGQLRGYWGTSTDITARKRADEALAQLAKDKQKAAARYVSLISASNTGAWEYDTDTGHLWASHAYFAMLGCDPADFPLAPGQRNVEAVWLDLVHPEDRDRVWQESCDYMRNPTGMYEHVFRMRHADGHWVWILSRGRCLRDDQNRPTAMLVGAHIDVTASKRAETYLAMSAQTVQILSQPGEFNELLEQVVALLREKTEFDAVGVHLRQGDDYPFIAQQGFAPEHVAACRDLRALDPDGNPLADAAGRPALRCICGLALSNLLDRCGQWFSPGGSGWTNDLRAMLQSGPDPRPHPHDLCLRANYRSIAWIPIRAGGTIVGLLQFHDRRQNQFTAESIQILESLANHVGEAMMRRRAEQDFRALFQSMVEGFALHEIVNGPDGQPVDFRFLEVNPAFETMMGVRRENILGKTGREVVPPADQQWFESFARVAETGNPLFFENYFAAQRKHFEVGMFRPGPNQFACIFSDITERKLVELELQESRRRFAALLAHLPGMAYRCRIDAAGTMDFVSEGSLALTGYAPRDLVGPHAMPFQDVVAPAYRDMVRQERERAVAARRRFEGEYQIVTRGGETKWVWEQGEAVYDAQGTAVALEGFLSDVTARKRAEADHDRLIRAIEQSGEMIEITDATGKILYVNPAFTAVTGYERADALGRRPELLRSGQHDAAFYRELNATLAAGRVWEGQLVDRRKDGTLFTVQTSISPVRDVSGRIVNFVAVNRDITHELRDQEEKDLLKDQLGQAQKMESIGRLAGGVAHDFNNMLQAILGYAEMALDRVPPGAALRDDLLEIQKAAQRSAALTRQLQIFARKQKAVPKVLDLNQAVEGMFSMLKRLIGEDIELVWRPGADLGTVRIDPSQLDQIVANLCVNARDAIGQSGHVILETRSATIDRFGKDLHGGIAPGDYMLLAVSDDGAGMTPEVQQHLFEPFFTTKQLGRGTGLGLSTVYGIVQQNHGGIQVYSEPGRGTTFKIYLPRHSESADVPVAESAETPASRGNETILLVEDEESILHATRRMLESLGYRVLVANSPTGALQLALDAADRLPLFKDGAERIDLLITDVIMPEMTGVELTGHLHHRFPGLRRLFMSGYTANLISMQGVRTSQADFIQKPFSRLALARKVREILDRAEPPQSA